MASRFASFTEEEILSINEAAVPKESIARRDFHFLLYAFVAVIEINGSTDNSSCAVYTKIIIHLIVGESRGGYLPPLR